MTIHAGRLLHVDLTTGKMDEQEVRPDHARDFIGGSGLGVRLLWDWLDPARDPLDPASPLLWMTGPLTGTGGPTNGRSSICARSPQTGLWGESNIGGFVGSELRYAGYDGLLITGRANAPVYLWIHNGHAELRDAAHLWGQADTHETQRVVKGEVGEPMTRVACIGPAGENRVPYAAILSDHGRLAGRTGMGAVMGSKNLKAIAVRGTGKLTYPREADYKRLRLAANKALHEENMTAVYHETGTAGGADYLEMLGDMPQKYWTQAAFEGVERIGGARMAETILTGKAACQGCVICCGRVVTINDGPFAASQVKGPEYETVASFGSQLLVDDLPAIVALGNRCDAVGIDAISAGNTIALAYLLFDRGLITPKDTGGLELRWGDARPCFELIEQLARREGFGALVAQGSKALAAHFGAEELAVHVNNLEVPMHDPRAMSGSALVYVTSPRGACHNQSDYFTIEMGGSIDRLGIPMTDRLEDGGKAVYVARHQDWRTVCNSLVMCLFASADLDTVVDLLSAATGRDWTLDEMMLAGERAWNLKRMINIRLGLTRASEKLPKLLLEPLPEGGQMGHVPDVDSMLQEYYAARGWDEATGAPTPQKLASLGLGFASLAPSTP
jgi:aldehyde:ferredoxin oxidoreductase